MRTCLKNSHEIGKNAKMNSSTQKCYTLKIVWKMIIIKIEENHENTKMDQIKKIVFSWPLEKYVVGN